MESGLPNGQDHVQYRSMVAVSVGGTGGIGALSLKALTPTVNEVEGKSLRAYVIGRNASAAQKIFSECHGNHPTDRDYALIKHVDAACEELVETEARNALLASECARIDYLMLSNGGPIFLPRQDTEEDVDGTMARFYCSRMAATTKLLPLLLRSALPATVGSVYAAGMEAKLIFEDLSLRQTPHYSFFQARSHIVYIYTCFFEELAKRYCKHLRLIHYFPGILMHKGTSSMDESWWLHLVFAGNIPFFGMSMDTKEVGARMVASASAHKYPVCAQGETVTLESAAKGTDSIGRSTNSRLIVAGRGAVRSKTANSKVSLPKH